MPRYQTAQLVYKLRERTGLARAAMHEIMLKAGKFDETSLRRIEGDKQHPRRETFEMLMKTIDLPQERFIYPLVEDQPMKAIIQCDYLNQALDSGDTKRAEIILAKLEKMKGFDSGAYLQFVLSKKARLWEQQGKPSTQIVPLIEAGMAETFEKFDENDINGIVFVLEEPELLHTRARLYARDGSLGDAIRILESMKSNLAGMPIADREKQWQFTPVLLSLSRCLMQAGDYYGVIEACDTGAEYSAIRRQGRHNPEFEFYKALAYQGIGRTAECRPHLKRAYFGHMLLGETGKAQHVLATAREVFYIDFDLFGVDQMERARQQNDIYCRGGVVDCGSLGSMINAMRDNAGLSLDELCQGICNKSTLLRIENDELPGYIFTLEAIMQRLGRDINIFSNFFLSKSDFISMQLRDQAEEMLIAQRYSEAGILLKELESMRQFVKNNVNKQFIETGKALIHAFRHASPPPEFPEMLLNALRITYPKFTELNIKQNPLTYNEIFIINAYAGYYKDIGDASRAADIYERLLRNLNERYVDEVAKARMYSTIVLNYSSCLGRKEDRYEALAVIEEGMKIEQKHQRLTMLPGLSFNKGYNMLKMGRDKESIPHFALAYYSATMFTAYDRCMEAGAIVASRRAKEDLGVIFD